MNFSQRMTSTDILWLESFILQTFLLDAENQTVTAAELSTVKVDFGKFPVSEVQSQEVVLRNTGNRPLVIHDITTSCGCTRVEYDKRPVAVGGETSIRIIYEAEHPGHFRKTADVYCNIAASRLRITVMGAAE